MTHPSVFVATNEETMEVHLEKTNADTFECGHEKIDIPLFTFESYKCSRYKPH